MIHKSILAALSLLVLTFWVIAYAHAEPLRKNWKLPAPVATTITNFASGHGYTKTSATGTFSDDTSDFVFGTQSVKMVTNGAAAAAFFDKQSISPAIDTTGKELVVWLKFDDVSKVAECLLYASNDNLTNFYSWDFCNDVNDLVSGKWLKFTAPLGRGGISTGSPDRAAFNCFRLRVKDKGTGAVTMNANLIAAQPQPQKGIVSVVFDDGFDDTYTTALTRLKLYGFKASVMNISNAVGTAGYMTLANLQELQNTYGWDIGNHTVTHTNLSGLTDDQARAEISGNKKYNLTNGLRSGIGYLAFPQGGFTVSQLTNVFPFYVSAARTIDTYHETLPAQDPYRLRTRLVVDSTVASTITTEITNTINNKDWLIITFHHILTATATSIDYSTANYNTVIDFLNSSGATVKTISEVVGGRLK